MQELRRKQQALADAQQAEPAPETLPGLDHRAAGGDTSLRSRLDRPLDDLVHELNGFPEAAAHGWPHWEDEDPAVGADASAPPRRRRSRRAAVGG